MHIQGECQVLATKLVRVHFRNCDTSETIPQI